VKKAQLAAPLNHLFGAAHPCDLPSAAVHDRERQGVDTSNLVRQGIGSRVDSGWKPAQSENTRNSHPAPLGVRAFGAVRGFLAPTTATPSP